MEVKLSKKLIFTQWVPLDKLVKAYESGQLQDSTLGYRGAFCETDQKKGKLSYQDKQLKNK